jgi:flagellar basal body-associated protein FliL
MDQPETENKAPVEKKSKGRLIGIVVALVLVLGAGAAGTIMGPKFFGAAPPAAGKSAESKGAEGHEEDSEEHAGDEESDEEEKPKSKTKTATEAYESTLLQPIIVDVATTEGQSRHLKIVLAIEHPETTKEADFKVYVPRAREAAIFYLRTSDFEHLANPKNFEKVREELNKAVIDAVGKKRAKRVLITDYVTQ